MFFENFRSDILFTGYYGQMNTGDDAFVQVASWGASKYWKKNNNIFLGIKENLPISENILKGYPWSIPRTYRLQKKILVANTDYLISAGGSTIHSELQLDDIRMMGLNAKINKSSIKIGAIGVSIGPFLTSNDEGKVIDYLQKLDFLAVRDQESYNFVKQFNFPYEPINAFDLAALMPEIYNKKNVLKSRKKVVGISVCPVESIVNGNISKEQRRNANIIELAKYLDIHADIHYKFFIINGHSVFGDLKLTKQIIEKIKPKSFEIVDYSRNTYKIWNDISNCDFVISTRLHAAIFACFSQVPFMLNEYHRKCSDFLDNIGYEDTYRLFNDEYGVENKAEKILEIIDNPKRYINPLFVNEMIEKARLNFLGVSL